MNVALVGCGSIAERHATCIGAHEPLVIEAIARSQTEGGAIEVRSSFEPPSPLEWAV